MITHKQLTLAEVFEDCQNKFDNNKYQFLSLLDEAINLDDSYDPYNAAYGSMPTHAASNQAIQQMYINGHFCYAYKFGIVTNGLGIVRDISFYNKDFLNAHPDIVVEKKSDSPDEDKSLADSKALLPVLIGFFKKHPLIEPTTFLGDVAFDTIEIYKSLFNDIGFRKAFIPLRVKLSMEGTDYTVNENGILCCPHDSTLPMKREGSKSHLRSKLPTMKFVCPKMKWMQESYRIFNQDCELVSQLPSSFSSPCYSYMIRIFTQQKKTLLCKKSVLFCTGDDSACSIC